MLAHSALCLKKNLISLTQIVTEWVSSNVALQGLDDYLSLAPACLNRVYLMIFVCKLLHMKMLSLVNGVRSTIICCKLIK